MKTKLLMALVITGLATQANAKTDTAEAIEQLKVNAENSEANYKQYKDNLDIVNKNVEQATQAVSELKKMRTQLIKNTQNVDKNKQALANMEKEILAMKAKEQAKMTAEDKQIAEVRAVLDKLEANKKLREANVLAYDQMVESVKREVAEWDTQVQQMGALQKQIDDKEKKATEEKNTWVNKRKDYEAEAAKWNAQSSTSRAAYNKIQKMK